MQRVIKDQDLLYPMTLIMDQLMAARTVTIEINGTLISVFFDLNSDPGEVVIYVSTLYITTLGMEMSFENSPSFNLLISHIVILFYLYIYTTLYVGEIFKIYDFGKR